MAWAVIVDCRPSYEVVLNRTAEINRHVDIMAVFGKCRIPVDMRVQESLI
jgi:hypothetical protein